MKTCELRDKEPGFSGMSSISASALMDVFSAKVLRHHFNLPESIPSSTCHRFFVNCQGGVKRLDATFAVAPRGHGAEEFHSWLKASRHPWADRLLDAIYNEHVV